MDSLITAAARALAAGDPIGALNRVALREDAPALALRGIAMAQLGDLARAKALLRRAARGFGSREAIARARCIVAEAEIALAARELSWPEPALEAARATLEAHGDRRNAAHARLLAIRRQLLVGQLDAAARGLATLDPAPLPAAARVVFELAVAGVAMRRLRIAAARTALRRAARAAQRAAIPALAAEVESAIRILEAPAARLITRDATRFLRLRQVETLLASNVLVVDACRNAVQAGVTRVVLARRPVLFALARALAQMWPGDVSRAELIARVFRGRQVDESHRARLRVEVGRLRAVLRPLASLGATTRGFALRPRGGRAVVVLGPPVESAHGAVLALLGDGEAWSSSALAIALGGSQRSVQRALDALAATGEVHSVGRGRARRWMTPPMPGLATLLLLSAPTSDA
jgi:tetratricopeptide (TPR) repeat protein